MKNFDIIKKVSLASGFLLGFVSYVYASDITIPNTFSSGDTVSSSQMNDNFSAIEIAVGDNDQRVAALENLDVFNINVINGDNSVLGVSIGADQFEAFGFLTDTNYKVQVRWDIDTNGYRIGSNTELNIVFFTNTTCTGQAYTNFINPKSIHTFDGIGVGYTGSSLIPIIAQSQLQFDSSCLVIDTPMRALTVNVNDQNVTAFDHNAIVFPVMLSR